MVSEDIRSDENQALIAGVRVAVAAAAEEIHAALQRLEAVLAGMSQDGEEDDQ